MIRLRLLTAQLQLQSHRRWLHTFIARSPSYLTKHVAVQQRSSIQGQGDGRAILPQRSAHTSNRAASFATKRLKLKKKNVTLGESYVLLKELRQAVTDQDIERVTTLYYSSKDKNVIRPNDFRIIAQCLHYALRAEKRSADAKTRRDQTEQLVAFAEKLVKDVIEGNIVPHCQAHVHLLGFFKESGMRDAGIRFWRWLELQDDLHVNPDVYGAAIELLAVNGTPLPEMEDLYQQSLSRFPGSFSAYHLSPEAIVPDRSQPTTLKGIPMSLLQGILTARLLRGDAQNAYLALDTALRLYPDQVPPRFFQLFLEERPLLEAYTVFAIACRGGVALPSNQFRQLLSALRTSSDLKTPVRHALAVRSMLSILYMYIGAGGQVTPNVLNEFVISVTQFLRLKDLAPLEAKKKQSIGKELIEIIRSLFLIFARHGVKPGLTSFNSIITNLGGFGHSREMIGIALADVQGLGLKPNEVTRRSILTAAGTLGDGEYVIKAWEGLVQGRAESGQYPDVTDFHVLIRNATAAGRVEFARLEFDKWKETLPIHHQPNLEAALEEGNEEPVPSIPPELIHLSSLSEEIQNVCKDLLIIQEQVEQNLKIQNFHHQSLPMKLLQTSSTELLPEKQLQELYDEMTSEQRLSQAPKEIDNTTVDLETASDLDGSDLDGRHLAEDGLDIETSPKPHDNVESVLNAGQMPALSPTNIPFDILRYENWKTINYLLELAEASEENYLKVVDAAIASGAVPPQRSLGLGFETSGVVQSYGLSDAMQPTQDKSRRSVGIDSAKIQAERNKILKLRGRLT